MSTWGHYAPSFHCAGLRSHALAERADGAFSKQVAVKLLCAPFLNAFDRLQHERDVLARLDHPNIARLLDGGSTPEDLPYLVMEFLEGSNLNSIVQDGAALTLPATRPVGHYDVREQSGRLEVELP